MPGRQARELEDEVRAVARRIDRCRELASSPLRLLRVFQYADPSMGCAAAPGSCAEALVGLALSLLVILLIVLVLALPYLIALPIIAVYRHRYQIRLRRLLTELREEDRRELLESLFHHPEDETAKIVAPLLRRLNLPYEVTPAAVAAGRGDEVSSG